MNIHIIDIGSIYLLCSFTFLKLWFRIFLIKCKTKVLEKQSIIFAKEITKDKQIKYIAI